MHRKVDGKQETLRRQAKQQISVSTTVIRRTAGCSIRGSAVCTPAIRSESARKRSETVVMPFMAVSQKSRAAQPMAAAMTAVNRLIAAISKMRIVIRMGRRTAGFRNVGSRMLRSGSVRPAESRKERSAWVRRARRMSFMQHYLLPVRG